MGQLPKSLLELRYSQRAPIGEIELEDRLRETLAVLDAICMGELLAAMPEHEADKKRHQTAVSLLDMLHDRLIEAVRDIDLDRG
jgi:hypothetical protein